VLCLETCTDDVFLNPGWLDVHAITISFATRTHTIYLLRTHYCDLFNCDALFLNHENEGVLFYISQTDQIYAYDD
jgi:hypothetical protein